MMIRRKTSERKAATQALQVIAESIRACRGRGGRPPASSPKLESLVKPCLQKSRSDIVKNIKITQDEGRAINYIVPMKTVMTRRDSQISLESIDSHSASKAQINKENLKPSQNCETKANCDLKINTKVSLMITDADGLNQLQSVLQPSNLDLDLPKAQLSMCPPEPVDQKNRKKTGGDQKISMNRQEVESGDQSSNSKTRKRLKGSGEQLELVLKLKKSQSLLDPVLNPEKMTPFYDNVPSQASLLSDNPTQALQKNLLQPRKTLVYEEEKKGEVYPPQSNDVDMNNFYEPQKKDINQSILSKKNNFQEKTNKPEDTRNQHLIIQQTYLMHHNTQQKEVPTADKTSALLDNKGDVSFENAAAPAVLSSNKVDETLTQQNEGSSQIGVQQSGAGSSINEDDEDDDITQTTGERQAQMQGCGGLSGSQGRWTDEEHDKFLEGMRLFGKDWRRIEEYIATRSCAQIRSHAQKYFNRLQRDLAKGIKRPDADQATILLGKKKRKHSTEGGKRLQMPPQQSASIVQQPPIKQLKTGVEPSQIVAPNSPMKESQTFNFGAPPTSSTMPKQFETAIITQPMIRQTNQQIQQISDALTKLVVPIEDQLVAQLQQLIGQREQISRELLGGRLPREVAGELLVELTHRFHSLAMQALNQYKFDVCNRLIDERNLTQFVCILLSRQVIIEPNQASEQIGGGDREIIQQVDYSPKRAEGGKEIHQPFVSSILNTSLQQQQLSSLQRNSYPQQQPQVATRPYC